MPGPRVVVVVAHAVTEGLSDVALIGKIILVVVDHAVLSASLFIEDHVVKANAIALGVDVQFANGVSLVTCVPESLRHGRQIGHRLRLTEVAIAVLSRANARHQGAARRDTHWAFAITIGESRTAASQLVDSRRKNRRMPGFAKQCGRPVVCCD